jgi:hypothetical protein
MSQNAMQSRSAGSMPLCDRAHERPWDDIQHAAG